MWLISKPSRTMIKLTPPEVVKKDVKGLFFFFLFSHFLFKLDLFTIQLLIYSFIYNNDFLIFWA